MNPTNTCQTCKHWESDYDYPWGHCDLTVSNFNGDDHDKPDQFIENAIHDHPESLAHADVFEWDPIDVFYRGLLATHKDFGCNQYEFSEDHVKWAEKKESELERAAQLAMHHLGHANE